MTNSLLTSVLLASGVGELREELVEQLQPAVEALVETVVKFVLVKPSPAATLTFDHVLNRANARMTIFEKEADYAAFEEVLEEAVERTQMRLLAYCVLPDHWLC
jgi:hypothetical protein